MSWQPSADISALQERARLLQNIRAFFVQRNVMEVSTPIISSAANTDVHIDSIELKASKHHLLTSPELPIKRLLAAGIGDCYQLGQVFRDGEVGRNHNPEFTMLEWYRLSFSMLDLMAEVEQLIQTYTDSSLSIKRYSYKELFQVYLGFDVLEASAESINRLLHEHDLWQAEQGLLDKDAALDLLFSQALATQFPEDQLTTVYHYPASQASLAQLNPADPRTAERFEVYWGELELANGFHELANAEEQRQRFEQDNRERLNADKPAMPIDQNFIAALETGFPDCSGVALGVDRLLMKLLDKKHIREVLSFDWERV